MRITVLKPRCPQCNKLLADWVSEAQFTCPRCHLKVTIGDVSTLKNPLLTIAQKGDRVLSNSTTE